MDKVYHLTLGDRLESLKSELIPRGGKPLSGDQAKWANRIDECRPEWILDLGISRAESVYAHPHLETTMRIVNKHTAPGEYGQKMVVISIDVDPKKVVVCDAFTLSDAYAPQEYWDTATTLCDFRLFFDVQHEYGLLCEVNEVGRGKVPFGLYYEPEVLIPGTVSCDKLGIAHISNHPLKPSVLW